MTPLTCAWCQTDESTRRGRRYCSLTCRLAAENQVPERMCQVCGVALVRATYPSGAKERRRVFEDRKVCAATVCKAEHMRSVAQRRDPARVGRRTMLARSCDDCGRLLPPPAFGGPRRWTCHACLNSRRTPEQRARGEVGSSAAYFARQAASWDGARRHGNQWTGPELELVATRADLSNLELATMLGRTVAGVMGAKSRLHEPKWRIVAGVDA